MSGSLDQPAGALVKREIKLVDVTGKTASEIEDFYNTNAGPFGWRIIQIYDKGSSTFIVAERIVLG